MKAYQSTLFFLVLLLVFTLLTRGSRALGESQNSSACTHDFGAGLVERPEQNYQSEIKYALDCKDSFNDEVTTKVKDFKYIDACVSAYKEQHAKTTCWCRMY